MLFSAASCTLSAAHRGDAVHVGARAGADAVGPFDAGHAGLRRRAQDDVARVQARAAGSAQALDHAAGVVDGLLRRDADDVAAQRSAIGDVPPSIVSLPSPAACVAIGEDRAGVGQVTRAAQRDVAARDQRTGRGQVARHRTAQVHGGHQGLHGAAIGQCHRLGLQPHDVGGQQGHLLGGQGHAWGQLVLLRVHHARVHQRRKLFFRAAVATEKSATGQRQNLVVDEALLRKSIPVQLQVALGVHGQLRQEVAAGDEVAVAGEGRVGFHQRPARRAVQREQLGVRGAHGAVGPDGGVARRLHGHRGRSPGTGVHGLCRDRLRRDRIREDGRRAADRRAGATGTRCCRAAIGLVFQDGQLERVRHRRVGNRLRGADVAAVAPVEASAPGAVAEHHRAVGGGHGGAIGSIVVAAEGDVAGRDDHAVLVGAARDGDVAAGQHLAWRAGWRRMVSVMVLPVMLVSYQSTTMRLFTSMLKEVMAASSCAWLCETAALVRAEVGPVGAAGAGRDGLRGCRPCRRWMWCSSCLRPAGWGP